MEIGGRMISIALILIVSMTLFNGFQTSSNGISEPANIIILAKTKITIPMDGVNNFEGENAGEVSCDLPRNGPDIKVSLSVNASGFEVSEIPDIIFTLKDRSKPFKFTISIPYNTTKNGEYLVLVSGKWNEVNTTVGGDFYPVSCILIVPQHYSMNLTEPEKITMRAGNSKNVRIEMNNTGNGADRPRIEISNLESLIERGWEIQLSMDKCSHPPGKVKIYSLNFKVPRDEKPGRYHIELLIISSQAEAIGDISYRIESSIEIEVLNNYGDELILSAIIVIPIGLILLLSVSLVIIIRRIRR